MKKINYFIALLFVPLLFFTHCASSDDQQDTPEIENPPLPKAEPENYQNSTYNFSIDILTTWELVERPGQVNGGHAIHIFPQGQEADMELPLHVHGDADWSYIAIWPKGIGTELPSGESKSFSEYLGAPTLKFPIDEEKSRTFLLKGGGAWAHFIVPQSTGENWADMGFIFAQYSVDDFSASCYDKETGAEISMKECDPMEGDRFVRTGTINSEHAVAVNNMLTSIRLPTSEEKPISALIRVAQPSPNIEIGSPYTVKGEARGQWFFEGSFPVRLYDAEGNQLAEAVAQAEGEWMTEEFVPFKGTLNFNVPDDQRGQLVFHRANPSDLPQNDRKYSLPILFSHK